MSETGLNAMRKYMTALTGKKCQYCDMTILESVENQFYKTENNILRVMVEENTLSSYSDNNAGLIYQFEHPIFAEEKKEEVKEQKPKAEKRYTPKFSSNKEFLII